MNNSLGNHTAVLLNENRLLDKFKGLYFKDSNDVVYEIIGSAAKLSLHFGRIYVDCKDYDLDGVPKKVSACRIFADCLNDEKAINFNLINSK
ncbi:MAG: hypothetical protein AABW50_04750 [Nanoarchaeota archaeon]